MCHLVSICWSIGTTDSALRYWKMFSVSSVVVDYITGVSNKPFLCQRVLGTMAIKYQGYAIRLI
ncbi:hypothetical protein MAR_004513 [Mya arenaria]|uniref:Uncharacterized protein n=1 Tax=Mya arenaria TaxID=6604 RepID=A0ABY7F0X9_MYAAR|nr:hypothetical protein MAR_004513 [Mya arenaria]